MDRLIDTWRSWSVRRRAITVAVVAVVATGLGVLAYELLKRPADVTNPDVAFKAKPEPKPKAPKDRTVDWPTYGYDDARTRYFPTDVVKPPFDSSDWSFASGKLLEFAPIIVDDVLYFQDIDARVYALDAKNGKKLWKNRIGKFTASAPAYANNRLFLVNLDPGQAVALRPRDGKVLWRKELPGRSESSPLAFQDKLVIFGCECGTVFALDQKDGSLEWQVDTAGEIKGALAQGKGNVFGGNYAGEVFSIDAESGRVEWRISTIGGSFGRGGGVYSTPAVGFGRVYFGSIDSRVYSVDIDTGAIAWSRSTGAEVYSGPALADTKGTPPSVYIGSADENFYALDARTGAVRWQKNVGADITGAASVIGDVVYVAGIGEAVGTIGFDVRNGKKVFEHELGEYNPVITDGQRLYLTGYAAVRPFPPEDPKKKKKKQQRKRGKGKADAKQGKAGDGKPKGDRKRQGNRPKRQRRAKNRS